MKAPSIVSAGERASQSDPVGSLDERARRIFAGIADLLIPAAHDMPSAAEVVNDERLRFVLAARPDLVQPLSSTLRPDLGEDPQARLDALARDETASLAALQLVIVAGYYTDDRVRELIGYPGQLALEIDAKQTPAYVQEGLVDAVLARGPVWRDPQTGQRAGAAPVPEGDSHGDRT
jgi:hypothetical protein